MCYNENMRTDYLNPKLYNKLYAVMTYSNVLALRVSLETGLRIDDVLSLKPEQLKGRTLRGKAEKTDKPYKKVISADLAKRLRSVQGKYFIFPHRTKEKEHRTRQAVWKNLKKACKIQGLTANVGTHSARKTYAVDLFHDSGIEKVQKELQHDRMSTTMIYAFADVLSSNEEKRTEMSVNPEIIDDFAEIVAEKVVKKISGLL
jgi:integrase